MELLIVGAGEMGRWLADTLDDVDVAFADADPAAAEAAVEACRRTGRRTRAVPLDAEESFGAVCVAVPLPAAADAVEEHASKAQQAVVDVTGAMVPPLAAMARVAPARERVSFHPLFAADAAPGNVAVSVGAAGPATDGIRRALEAAGNDLVEVDPEEHDRAMRTVQGRAHAAVLAFGLAAEPVPEGLETPVYEEMMELVERVTENTPRVYADIQDAFDGASDVADAAERLAAADDEEFERLYEDAGRRSEDAGR